MERELVFVHGRAQEGKDPVALKAEWIDALRRGLSRNGLTLPIPEDRIRFPFYGDTLMDLVKGVPDGAVAEVVVRGAVAEVLARGSAEDPMMGGFVNDVLGEVAARLGIPDEEIDAAADQAIAGAPAPVTATGGTAPAPGLPPVVLERGVANWKWVQAVLTVIDRHVPGGSALGIALATQDVYRYLNDAAVRDRIEGGVRQAMQTLAPGRESVVVSHSLGTVVAYNMLRREGAALGWKVPLFVTLGSPLAVNKIRQSLSPNRHPECVGQWFNALDPDDVVSLYPLNKRHFPIVPIIENKTDIDNRTDNQHGISGYLDDPVVARRIYDALVA
jgi:hypothetical protein